MRWGKIAFLPVGLALASLLIASPAPRPASKDAASSSACGPAIAAFDYVASMQPKDRRWVLEPLERERTRFQLQQFTEAANETGDEWYEWIGAISGPSGERMYAPAPGPGLITRVSQWQPGSLETCAGVAAHAAASGVLIPGAGAVGPVPTDNTAHPVTTVRISTPLLSDDRRQAVIYAEQISGPLAGGGYMVVLVRGADDHWRPVSLMPLWVS